MIGIQVKLGDINTFIPYKNSINDIQKNKEVVEKLEKECDEFNKKNSISDSGINRRDYLFYFKTHLIDFRSKVLDFDYLEFFTRKGLVEEGSGEIDLTGISLDLWNELLAELRINLDSIIDKKTNTTNNLLSITLKGGSDFVEVIRSVATKSRKKYDDDYVFIDSKMSQPVLGLTLSSLTL